MNPPISNESEIILQNGAPAPECQQIEQLLLDPLFSIVTWIQILLIFIIFLLIALFFHQYFRTKVPFHRNLLLLVFNLILFYLIYSIFWFAFQIRYKFLLFTYSQNCDLLTPVWLAAVLTAPSYFQLVANSGIHFAIMLERVRATVFVRNYERKGHKYAIGAMAVVWSLSIAYTVYIICSALADTENFTRPLGLVALTSKYNKLPQVYSYYVTLFFSILTALGDYCVIRMNWKIKRSAKNAAYSLSQNFQLKENLLSMRLILPLDAAYVFLFCVYVLIGYLLREHREQLGNLKYTAYYYIAQMLPMLHSAISLFIYTWFLRRMSRTAGRKVEPLNLHAELYFKQLEQQWNIQNK